MEKLNNDSNYENDWLSYLMANSNNQTQTHINEYIGPCTIELIFSICQDLHQNTESRYLTLELYDQFSRLYYGKIKKLHYKRWTRGATLKTMITQVQNEILLRIISCVQLSSKFCGHSTSMNLRKTLEFLKRMEKPFSKHRITQSEAKVFQHLDFSVNSPPTLYVYAIALVSLVEQYVNNEQQLFDQTLTNVMDLVYMRHDKILEALQQQNVVNKNALIDNRLVNLLRNKLFYAACIVLTSVRICYGENWSQSKKIAKQILDYVEWSADDINVVINIVYAVVINDSKC